MSHSRQNKKPIDLALIAKATVESMILFFTVSCLLGAGLISVGVV